MKAKQKEEKKLKKEQEKQAKLEKELKAKQEAELKAKEEEEKQLELKRLNDINNNLVSIPFEVVDDSNNEFTIRTKKELMDIYLSKPNNKLYHKIKTYNTYKPFFRIKTSYKENEKPSKIQSKNEAVINETITIISQFFNLNVNDAEKIFIVKRYYENIVSNLKGNLLIYTIDIIVKNHKCIGYYCYDLVKEFENFNTEIYNDNFKYPIDINEDFEKLITFINNNYNNILIDKKKVSNEIKYVSNKRANRALKAFEKYDRKALKYMINNIGMVRDICNNKENSNGNYDYDIEMHLNKIWNGLIDNNILEVLFLPTENNPTGRKYASNASYQNIARKIRHTLAHLFYIDIDFINCHFVLLLDKCRKYKLEEERYKYIKRYVEDRDFYINDIKETYSKTRDEAKSLIISITYGADINLDKLKWFNDFKAEIKYLSHYFSTHNDYQHFLNISGIEIDEERREALKNGEEPKIPNLYGKTLSKILCSDENSCLECLLEFLKSLNIDYCAFAFDGCMVDKFNKNIDEGRNNEFLIKADAYILEKIGIPIKTTFKELNDIINLPSDYIYTLEDRYIIEFGHDVDASNIIIEHYGHLYIKCENERYVKYNNIWTNDEKIIKEVIISHIKPVNILYKTSSNFKSYTQNYCHIKACFELTLLNGFRTDNNFINESQRLTKYYLPFIDGIYSFKDKKLYSYDELPYLNFTQQIYRKFPIYNEANHNELMQRILNPILPYEVEQKYYLHSCSRALAGCFTDKKWYVGVGARNCGKSVLTKLFEKSFGCYVSSFDAKTLIYNKFGNPEPARALGWVVSVKDCRLIISNEIGTDDEKAVLNGNFIKTLASAGDEMTGRQLYKNIIKFTPQFTMFLNCNKLPDINPDDAMENLEQFNYKSQFVNEEDLLDGVSYLKLKDDGVKELLIENRILDAFILVLLNAFENTRMKTPKDIQLSSEIAKGEKSIVSKERFILKNFKTTNNKEDKIFTEELHNILRENEYSLNIIEVGRLFNSLKIGKYNSNTSIKKDNKTVRKGGFEYIKYIKDAKEEEVEEAEGEGKAEGDE